MGRVYNMGYTIELSVHLEKCSNITDTANEIFTHANKCHAETCYEQYEMTGNVKHPRRHCIFITTFDDEYIDNCSRFVTIIKKIKHVMVECIYHEKVRCSLLYASPYYIKNMEKHEAENYKNKRNERSMSLSEGETVLLNCIHSLKHKARKSRSKTMGDKPSTNKLPVSPYLTSGPAGLGAFGTPGTT